jgi:hypothetical protein
VILRILCACVTRFLFSKVLVLMNIVFPSLKSKGTTIEVFLDNSGFEIFAGASYL